MAKISEHSYLELDSPSVIFVAAPLVRFERYLATDSGAKTCHWHGQRRLPRIRANTRTPCLLHAGYMFF